MAEVELPVVAKSVLANCKKCGEERYHTVLAHPTSTSAKMKCEVCGATKTQKYGTAVKKPKSDKPAKPAKPGKPGGRTRINKADEHKNEYAKMLAQTDADKALKYDMKAIFQVNQKLNHPKFGVGIIRVIQPNKIEVVFQDEVRNLVHNRQ